VYEILRKGTEVARERGQQTLAEVKAAMKINYFEDTALIAEQAEKYKNASN
jgi:tryptophanyl-tRNA synthetase